MSGGARGISRVFIRDLERIAHIYRWRELGDFKWSAVFAHAIVIERPRAWNRLRWVLGHFDGVLGCKPKEAFTVTRLTIGVPNDLQMAGNLTGGLPVLYQGRLANLGPFRESLTPAHNRREEGDAGGHRSAGLKNGQRGKGSDA